LKRVDPRRLVFLDESGVRTGMKRLYGRSAKGCRIVDRAPAGRWETHTVVAAIRTAGVASAMVTRKAINSITFCGFIEEFLCPTLSPGDVVVLDNLAVHKVKGVASAIQQAGAELWYLPPYSPDFNPIEQVWSKVKSVIRSLCPPSYRQLVRAIGDGLHRIDPVECQNYFRNVGYTAH
jgi:transposase